MTYLLQLKLSPAPVVGIGVEAGGEQAPNGSNIHSERTVEASVSQALTEKGEGEAAVVGKIARSGKEKSMAGHQY